ncbi:MAG: hypothetical protein ACTSUO_06175 [Candidatus Thorarchaeota archaeon]
MTTQKRPHKTKERENVSPDTVAEMLELFWHLSSEEKMRIVLEMKHSHTDGGHQPLQFSWAGSLKDFRDEFTSLEIQKKALEWRTQ